MLSPKTILTVALLLAVCFHGTALFYTLSGTYDAYVHIFFADHYARAWFEPWEYRWYTGFTITSYPPLSHQLIALLSKVVGLKMGFALVMLTAVCGLVVGTYRFGRLWVSNEAAAYGALFAVFASSVVQTVHIYGQLPTLCGVACLTNALPDVYAYTRTLSRARLWRVWSLLGVTATFHHVTTIYGLIFFIAPVVATALLDGVGPWGGWRAVAGRLWRLTARRIGPLLTLGAGVVGLVVGLLFPYWYWSRTDPITQMPIPHGSRDSFIDVPSSGLMFFIIPLGITLLLLPYVFGRLYTRRNIFLALSFSMLLLLGTGGTTPLPRLILGNYAFSILTLDRFTFWATVIAMPFVGELAQRLLTGDLYQTYLARHKPRRYRLLVGGLVAAVGLSAVLIVNLGRLRPLQPAPIETQPIVDFLNRDMHSQWRFLTLGFGDQMAWLSAQTTANSIDGNYHSARRVIELTATAVERLENAKFKGIQGIGSLQQFLTVPEKYHLKFIFSNDKFYDPMLYFAGWERVQRLDNGILVWQKNDVPPLPSFLPSANIPTYQKLMWGLLPLSALLIMVLVWAYTTARSPLVKIPAQEGPLPAPVFGRFLLALLPANARQRLARRAPGNGLVWGGWLVSVLALVAFVWLKNTDLRPQRSPETTLQAYYNALNLKHFQEAYTYLAPTQTYDAYLLQLSVRDGLLASYSKLDSLQITLTTQQPNRAVAQVWQKYVTPIADYIVQQRHELVRRAGKWWLVLPPPSTATAPDPFMMKGVSSARIQGKRTLSTSTTVHEDIMDRPELYILSARLVKFRNRYAVVGELQNTDVDPAHITIEAQLFDKEQHRLVSYNVKYTTSHKVLPKEVVPFRVDFEETAWVKTNDTDPLKFDPDEFTAFQFRHPPTTFKLFARAVVADKDLFRDATVQQLTVANGQALGQISNQGTEAITVPQVLMALYDSDKKVVWVDHFFIQEAIRPQQRRAIQFAVPAQNQIRVIETGQDAQFFVNGLPHSTFRPPYTQTDRPTLIPTQDGFLQVLINAYIAAND